MTPYEKAKDLVNKCQHFAPNFDAARGCAAIVVFEIIQDRIDGEVECAYWQDVRQEIYALSNPLLKSESKADLFNEDLKL